MEDSRKSRFSDAIWFEKSQEKSALIIGAGGIGSWLALFLGRIGFNITIFDNDKFEETNLGGQFVDRFSVGKFKTTALTNNLLNFGVDKNKIYSTNSRFGYDSVLFSDFDIIISAVDNMESRKNLFNYFMNESEADLFVDGRLLMEQIDIFCVKKDDRNNIKTYQDKFLYSDEESADEQCTAKQTSHTAAMIASLMTSFITNHISNEISGSNVFSVPFHVSLYTPLMF